MNTFSQRDSSPERGGVIVELALLIPVMMLLAFGSLEFSSNLGYSQQLSTLSREAANLASRECIDETNDTFIRDCLRDVTDHINSILNGAGLILTH